MLTPSIQTTLQGSFILAKAQGSAAIVAPHIDPLRQHVANLLSAHPGPGIVQVTNAMS